MNKRAFKRFCKEMAEHISLGTELEIIHKGLSDERIKIKFQDIPRNKISFHHDQSLRPNERKGYNHTREIVIGGRTGVRISAIDKIRNAVVRCKSLINVNWRCGHHIHIRFNDEEGMSDDRIKRIYRQFTEFQDVIYSLFNVREEQERYGFCAKNLHLSKRSLDNINIENLSKLDSKTQGRVMDYQSFDTCRYRGLNIRSIYKYGTLEFRLFNGTFNGEKIRARFMFVVAFVLSALNTELHYNERTWSAENLHALYNRIKDAGNAVFGRYFGNAWLNGIIRNTANSRIMDVWTQGRAYYENKNKR